MRRYFLAVNAYRTSSSDGFGNTWGVVEVQDRKHQLQVLRDGLPVKDAMELDDDGRRAPCLSTMGVRLATPAEIAEAKREEDETGYPIERLLSPEDLAEIEATVNA